MADPEPSSLRDASIDTGPGPDGGERDAAVDAGARRPRPIERVLVDGHDEAVIRMEPGRPLGLTLVTVDAGGVDGPLPCPVFSHVEMSRMLDVIRLNAWDRMTDGVCNGAIDEVPIDFALPGLPVGRYTLEADTLVDGRPVSKTLLVGDPP